MISPEEMVLHLARLGLAGDADSVQRYVLRLMRHANASGEHPHLRMELGKLLAKPRAELRTLRSVQPRDPVSFQHLLDVRDPSQLDEPLLEQEARRALEEVINEHQNGERLRRAGLEPSRSILLVGSPGVGKTMSAGFLARRLELPLMVLDLAAVVSSLLGRTGQNLKSVLDHARAEPCVLLMDEFDALAKRRDDPADVGELKRIVNVLLVELEQWPKHGLLVAATNHPELLDRAVERRFSRVIHVPLPGKDIRNQLIARAFLEAGHPAMPEVVEMAGAALHGESPSTIERLCLDALRRVVLGEEPDASFALFRAVSQFASADGRRADREEALRSLTTVALKSMRLSYRDAAERLGVSHMTVARSSRGKSLARPAKGKARTK